MRNTTYTTESYIQALLELKGLQPDTRTWSEDALGNNPPRLLRYQRLVALGKAFDQTGTPADVYDGRQWMLGRPNLEPLAWLWSGLPENRRTKAGYEVQLIWRGLLSLLKRARALTDTSVLEAPASYAVVVTAQQDFTDAVAEPSRYLGRQLGRMLDPQERTFTQQQLVEQFGFPTQNLSDLDFDWM